MSKIRQIILDFDGVCLDCKDAHYVALNLALEKVDPKFIISEQDHISIFDGLSTRAKLDLLVKERNFPIDQIENVFKLKQELTIQAIEETTSFNQTLFDDLSKLKSEGYILYVASNAIRATLDAGLSRLGVLHLFDKIISNEDVTHPKPHPEIYLKAMIEAGVAPAETLIVEDSKNGRKAAMTSGAHLCDVDAACQTTYETIKASIARAEGRNKALVPWYAMNTLNVLLVCAGAGSRLRAKYQKIKPLIDIKGKTMIQRVVENLNVIANFTFIVQQEHYDQYNLGAYLKLIYPGCTVLTTSGLTSGAAETSLFAKDLINNDKHLLIANSDQLLEDFDSADFFYQMISSKVDGGILTFSPEASPKWSFVSQDENGYVTRVAEKDPISDVATIGVYYFNKGSDYVAAAEEMIAADERVNNEFYIAPTYNYMIAKGAKISIYDVSKDKFHPTGTIDDLENVLNNVEFHE